MSWPTVPLGQAVRFLSGFAFKSEKFNTDGKGMPIIRIRDVVRGRSETYYDGEYDTRYVVQNGDFLIGMDGEFNLASWKGGPALLNQRVCKLDQVSDGADLLYIAKFLPIALKQIEAATPFVTVKHLSVKDLVDVQLPFPPLDEQRRIAAILDQAEELRAKRRAAIALLDQLPQAIFLEMFGDPATNPMGWPIHRLGALVTIRRGGSPRPIDAFLGGTINWIKIGDATGGSDLYIESCRDKIIEEGLKKTVFLKVGSMVFANCGVSLGFARILKIDGCIHDGWLSFEDLSADNIHPIFLLKLINQSTPRLRTMAPDGTQPNLNTGIMKAFELPLPPVELQKRFAASVEAIYRAKAAHQSALTELDALFASLQLRAFSNHGLGLAALGAGQ
jgi:type I restriction enzyme S subunit